MIKLHNDININEITKFTKKETAGGNFTYKCDGGHDDCVMTLVSLSSVFSHVQYKNLIEDYINNNLTTEEKNVIDKYAYNKSDEKVNYDITKNAHKNIYKNGNKKPPRRNQNGFVPWKSSPWN
jgi:hypothetical protein